MDAYDGPHSAAQNPKVKVLNDEVRQTMVHKLTTLPYNDFMAEFLPPIAGEPDGDAYNNVFDTVPTGGKETDMYQPFVRDVPRSRRRLDEVI